MNYKENLINALTLKDYEKTPVAPFPLSLVGSYREMGLDSVEKEYDPELMAKLALSGYEKAGIEGVSLPFDFGFGLDNYGCKIETDYDGNSAKIIETPYTDFDDLEIPENLTEEYKYPVLKDAIKILQETHPELPIVCTETGPFTELGELFGVEKVLKTLNTDYYAIEDAMDTMIEENKKGIDYFESLDVDCILIAEPNSSPDLLNPEIFENLVAPCLEEITDYMNIPSVIHVCGNTTNILEPLLSCGFNGISIAEEVNISEAKRVQEEINSETRICGNISTTKTLFMGTPEEVKKETIECLDKGVDILSPSCMFAPTTPIENVKAIVEARNEYFE